MVRAEVPAVLVSDLRKRYGTTTAVDGISFTVRPGEIFGLLGPNGSGKTTTVECLEGLRHPDAGRLEVFGTPAGSPAARRVVGCQLQDSALPDRLRVWEALRLFARIAPGGPSWESLLEEWGLSAQRRTAFGDLSGGQRQRLFVALALLSDPRLVVLDEMTTGLDPSARRVAWRLVEEVRERGATVLLVTHFMDEAERLCDRVAVLVDGRVATSGTVAEVVRAAGTPRAVTFGIPPGTDASFLRGVPGVSTVAVHRSGRVTVSGEGPLLARVAHALVERGLEPDDLATAGASLEDAFLRLTGDSGARGQEP